MLKFNLHMDGKGWFLCVEHGNFTFCVGFLFEKDPAQTFFLFGPTFFESLLKRVCKCANE